MRERPPAAELQELAVLVRGALVIADRLALSGVGIDLDSALNRIAEIDGTGSVAPQPYSLPADEPDELDQSAAA